LKDYIEERALEIAKYIVSEKATVRQAAKVFGVSKSTVHKDVTERLPRINPLVATMVKGILETNKAERHIRGGKATKMKYSAANE
jgi:putative DeoR family transcriptional regulator (stage III sporulation protein D)